MIRAAIIHGWSDIDTPISLEIEPEKCPTNALGYRAASVVGSLSALSLMHDRVIFEDIATKAHEVMTAVEPLLGPTATSTATHGSATVSNPEKDLTPLWTIKSIDGRWDIHHMDVPEMRFVAAFPNNPGECLFTRATHSVRRQKSFAMDIFKDAGKLARKGLEALLNDDLAMVGQVMNETDKLSAILGMHDPCLTSLSEICRRNSMGVMVSGAAIGGCVVALTDEPDEVIKSIDKQGVPAIALKTTSDGIRV